VQPVSARAAVAATGTSGSSAALTIALAINASAAKPVAAATTSSGASNANERANQLGDYLGRLVQHAVAWLLRSRIAVQRPYLRHSHVEDRERLSQRRLGPTQCARRPFPVG